MLRDKIRGILLFIEQQTKTINPIHTIFLSFDLVHLILLCVMLCKTSQEISFYTCPTTPTEIQSIIILLLYCLI